MKVCPICLKEKDDSEFSDDLEECNDCFNFRCEMEESLVVAIIMAPLTIIYQSVNAGTLVFDWKAILVAALGGGIEGLF